MVPKGTHIKDKRVNYFRTPSLTLDFPVRVPYHVDGELNFAESFNISIIPGGINLIYNPDGQHYYKRG
jgi:diacylglycerol kinase family enzyme